MCEQLWPLSPNAACSIQHTLQPRRWKSAKDFTRAMTQLLILTTPWRLGAGSEHRTSAAGYYGEMPLKTHDMGSAWILDRQVRRSP